MADLSNSISANNIDFLENYLEIVRENLKYTAKEISELKSRLKELRARRKNVKREAFDPGYSAVFELANLVSEEGIQGFLASLVSTDQIMHIDSKDLQDIGQVRGDWFPFEIKIGEQYFVIDDDGSIYTSTENFPEYLIKNSCKEMEKIVSKIISANEK